jgi:multiple sugar transport system substrate-binding protein
VLEFYRAIAEASPPGELYWEQSRELYFSGNAAMIIWSPFILDELAGLRDSAPPTINDDPTSRDLASRTGHRDQLRRSVEPRWRGLGRHPLFRHHGGCQYRCGAWNSSSSRCPTATPKRWPSRPRASSRSATARRTTDRVHDAWATLDVGVDRRAPLGDLYAAEMIDEIVGGLDVAQRWGVADGQLALASR